MKPELISARHLRVGFAALALFVVLGAVLEAFHAWKAPFYLDAGLETRRLLLRLAHAHGTLIALVNVAYGLAVNARPGIASSFGSTSLLAALMLVPLGFFAGAVGANAGDPGIGIVLVPAGALALLLGLVVAARRV